MRPFLIFLLLLLALPSPAAVIADEGAAREYCDRAPLLRIEGIWEFPSDGTRVLVRRVSPESKDCALVLLSSPDCRLNPGEEIGRLEPAGTPGSYRLSLCRRRSKGILSDPGHCAATLSTSGNSLSIRTRKFKLSLRSFWFLPRFWRALRISLSDPAGALPDGLVRIYPLSSPDRSSDPIYL